jgi:hypothetical protein
MQTLKADPEMNNIIHKNIPAAYNGEQYKDNDNNSTITYQIP